MYTSQHKIFKKTWKERFIDLLLSDFSRKMLKFAGLWLIYFTVIHHFDIQFNVWEAGLIGLGMGLVVE